MDAKKSWSVGFEFVDIEIIDHNESEKKKSTEKFGCDQCNMFFCNQEKLKQHQKEHEAESVKCRYCNKTLSMTEESKESYTNRKCETCEYRCSQCPQRFLRHSSLLNHEKNHILPRKRKTPLAGKKCINGLKTPRNSEISKLLKKRKQEKPIEESDEEEDSITPRIGLKKKQKYRSESTDFDNSAANYNDGVIPNNSKEIKRLPFRASKSLGEEKLGAKKKKSSLASNNVSPAFSPPLDNSVNYKPFSCHVCGDTFATDHDLLEHIRSHGEVAKSFRCKHCGDEFEDIYKMQFHLAVCPFAEDELDSSIKKPSIPHQTKTIPSPSATPRKRGRPRKVTVDVNTSTSEDEPEESVRKTKAAQTFMTLPKRISRKRTYKPVLNESGSGIDQEESDSDNSENCDDPRLDEDYIPTRTKDLMDGGEDSKKVHACPFPRCAFKFTREKALLCHMRNHTDDFDEALKCHKCDTPFDDLQSLRTHIDECREVREETEETDDDFVESSEDPENDDENDTPFHKFQKSKGTLCRVCKRAYSSTAKLKSLVTIETVSSKQNWTLPGNVQNKFRCNLCQAVFKTELEENNHMVLHSSKSQVLLPPRPSKCEENKISPSKPVEFKKDSDENSFFECDRCCLLFKTNGEYMKHRRLHLVSKLLACKKCNIIFTSGNELMKHVLQYHRFTCNFCSKSFTNKSALFNHKYHNHRDQVVVCPICTKKFLSRYNLFLHVSHHTNSLSIFQCQICGKIKHKSMTLSNHIMFHHVGRSLKRYNSNCVQPLTHKTCERLSITDLIERINKFAPNPPIVREFSIDLQTFLTEKINDVQPILRERLENCPNNSTNVFKSALAPIKLSSPRAHTGLGDLNNSITDVKFNSKTSLSNDLDETCIVLSESDSEYSQINRFVCPCSEVFTSKEELTNHILVHI